MAKATTQATPEEEKRAQDMWGHFTHVSKYTTIGIVGILAALCLIFIV